MARTHVQQTQISGSLDSLNVDLSGFTSGESLTNRNTLLDDLNALRFQVKSIVGNSHWYDGLTGGQDLNDIFGAMQVSGADATMMGHLVVSGDAEFDGSVYVTGSTSMVGLSGSLAVNGSSVFSGSAGFDAGITVTNGGIEVKGDTLEVSGSFLVSGSSALDGTLSVSGVADFNGDVTANKISIDGDVAQRLYIVGANNEISDEASLTFDGSELAVTGAVDISGASDLHGAVHAFDTLTVDGAATMQAGLTVNGAVADFNADVTANKISIDGDVAQRLYIVGANNEISDEEKMTFDGSLLLVTGSGQFTSNLTVEGGSVTLSNSVSMASSAANKLVITAADEVEVSHDLKVVNDLFAVSGSFTGDVTVLGDLKVQGATTWIETDNLVVKDTLIHLNVSGSALTPRGIVLHGDVAGEDDLAFGAAGTSHDFVFAKDVDHSDVDLGNGEIFEAAKLAAAKMQSLMLGATADVISGSLSYGSENITLSASNDLILESNGNSVGLMEAADWSNVFGAGAWAEGETIVAALNTLYAAGAGGAIKGNLGSGQVDTGVLTFSSLGTLNAVDQKFIDVYLNGVLLAYGSDVTNVQAGSIGLDADIASQLTNQDVITVVLRGATAA